MVDSPPPRPADSYGMTAVTLNEPPPDNQRRCCRCGQWQELQARACGSCLAPLNKRGVVSGLERPFRPNGMKIGGSVLACVGAAASLYIVGAPALRRWLYPPPPPPPSRY